MEPRQAQDRFEYSSRYLTPFDLKHFVLTRSTCLLIPLDTWHCTTLVALRWPQGYKLLQKYDCVQYDMVALNDGRKSTTAGRAFAMLFHLILCASVRNK